MIDRRKFFSAIRQKPFGGSLDQGQVDGINAILDAWDASGLTDLRWLSYILATPFHETARTMQPVIETRRPDEAENPSVDSAIARIESSWTRGRLPWVKTPYWRKDASGISWLGRGLVQLTHRANYERAEKETGIPLTKRPDLMLEMEPAVTVLIKGMVGGWFTGRKLSEFFHGDVANWSEARRIINSLDRADEIAGYGRAFHDAILAAQEQEPSDPPPVSEGLLAELAALRARVVDLEAWREKVTRAVLSVT